jgi:hypothetical protein
MDFFDSFAPPGPDRDDEDHEGGGYGYEAEMFARPEGWVGASVEVGGEIARSPRAAIFLTQVTAYPMGFEFGATAFLAGREREPGTGGTSSASIGGVGTPLGATMPPRIGVEFADGRKAAVIGAGEREDELGYAEWDPTVPSEPWDTPPDSSTHITMQAQGGGGTESQYEQTFWVWGRPPVGAVAFVADWEEFDVDEGTHSGGGRAHTQGVASSDRSLAVVGAA